jgi:hypothetical protein
MRARKQRRKTMGSLLKEAAKILTEVIIIILTKSKSGGK